MENISQTILLTSVFLLASILISMVFTRLAIKILPMFNMIDIPHGRHQHDHPVPRGGGIAIILAYGIVISLYLFMSSTPLHPWYKEPVLYRFLPPMILLTVMGVIDDAIELRAFVKLIGHIAIGVYFYFTGAAINDILGYTLPLWLGLPLTVCWVIGIINAFNLIDGMDGVAAGLASISSFLLAMWLILEKKSDCSIYSTLIFCGACLGFLRYNFSPAKIFMGDTGSMFIGLFFAYFSIEESAQAMTFTSLIVPVLAMGVPLFDVFLAITRRLYRKYIEKDPNAGIMVGDHDHLHHRIQAQVKNPRKTAYLLYAMCFGLAACAIFAALATNVLHTLGFVLLLTIIFLVIRFATIEFYDATALIAHGIGVPRRSFLLTAAHPIVDVVLLTIAYVLTSLLFQRDITFDPYTLKKALCYIAPYPVIMGLCHVYKTYWLRSGPKCFYRLVFALCLSFVVVLCVVLGFILHEFGLNRDELSMMREFLTTYALLGSVMILLERLYLHYIESYEFRRLAIKLADGKNELDRTMIYGGGLYCRMFLLSQHSASRSKKPVRRVLGIIDDNPSLRGLTVNGFDVKGTSRDLEELYQKYKFTEIVIALQTISNFTRNRLIAFCDEKKIAIREFQCDMEDMNGKRIPLTQEEREEAEKEEEQK